jgi:hypothetical protein
MIEKIRALEVAFRFRFKPDKKYFKCRCWRFEPGMNFRVAALSKSCSAAAFALGEPVSECEPLQPTGGEVTDRAGEKRSPKSYSEWESLSTTGSSVSECPEVRLAPQKANATRVAQSAS